MTFVQSMVNLWKSLPQKVDAGGVRGFRKDLYDSMKEMFISVRHNPLLHKTPQLQCRWDGFLRKYHYVLLLCNDYRQSRLINIFF